jgi:hypothetical protein
MFGVDMQQVQSIKKFLSSGTRPENDQIDTAPCKIALLGSPLAIIDFRWWHPPAKPRQNFHNHIK